MGCNQTKTADIQKSQEPRQRQTNVQPGGQKLGTAQGISIQQKAFEDLDAKKLGVSYHDQREGEREFFKNLIDTTASNFIDVYATVAPLEGQDAAIRAKDYTKQIQKSKSTVKEVSLSLFSLPTASLSNSSTSFSSGVQPSDIELLGKFSKQVASTLQQMKIQDCGPIVVPFSITIDPNTRL